MRFLADEGCDFSIVRAIRAAGHDVVAIREFAPGVPDEHVIRLAVADQRILLTEDRDFGRLVFASAMDSPGVVYLRFAFQARQAMIATILSLVDAHAAKLPRSFVVVQPGRIRMTHPKGT